MNVYLNYLLESNIGLCLFLVLYIVLLKRETDFRLKRVYLLTALAASVILPLFHINASSHVVPSLSDFVPPNWLPEVTVGANGTAAVQNSTSAFDAWFYAYILYSIGVIVFMALFVIQLMRLLRMIYTAASHRYEKYIIIESKENKSAFSFFRFIFIGQTHQLSENEKQQIIDHECVHAEQLHSIDILVVNLLSIFFWFNPCMKVYKKIFIQLHEFEADARAVANRDVNDYCSLLAKVALLSADFTLANHFSNSLTVKRIEMMRTIKSKIKRWKIAAVAAILPAFFFAVACQDQVAEQVNTIARNSTMAIDLPEVVVNKLNEMKAAAPDKKFIVIEPDKKDENGVSDVQKKTEGLDGSQITTMNVMKDITDKNGNVRSFIIIEYDEVAEQVAMSSRTGEVFTMVEQSATYKGGMEALGSFISDNLVYPEEARTKGLQGKVFVQFIVNADGSISDPAIKKGVDTQLDNAALAVVKAMPNWNPGKQKGKAVRQQFVLPVNFALD